MIYNKVLNICSPELESVREIYENSFPVDERRDWSSMLELISCNDAFILEAICRDDSVVGVLSWWQLDGWRFVEHFAIDVSCRGSGIGREVLQEFLLRSKLPVVLEVEPPTDYYSRRRIAFYQSEGFVLHDTYRHIQPSYGEGREPIELFLMTYATPLGCNLDSLSGMLHSRVYGVEW